MATGVSGTKINGSSRTSTGLDLRLRFRAVRFLTTGIVALTLALLFAAAGLVCAPSGASARIAGHAHVHHHGGDSHHHGHSHHDGGRSPKRADSPACSPVGSDGDDDHHCCGGHHHDRLDGDAVPARQRDKVPTPAAIVCAEQFLSLGSATRRHLQHWPYARGQPPDHLIHLRTVVLLT